MGNETFQSGSIEIRRYMPADKRDVCNLHVLALEAVGAYLPSPWNADLENIEDVYISGGGEFLVGTHRGEIIAMGGLKRVDARTGEIKRMRVHPMYWRRGWGQKILLHLERRAGELEFSRLILDTTLQQEAAQGLYIKNGYFEVARKSVDRFEVILFEKYL